MYVLCAGMYRACSTWQYDVVAHLLETHRDAERLGYLTGDQFAAAHPKDDGRVRVLKSHEGHAAFSRLMREGRAVVIYAVRDLRDVVYSLMHKRSQSFDELLGAGMFQQILVNDRYWRSRAPRVVQRYETLIEHPVDGVRELAEALGFQLRPGEAEDVAERYSHEANRVRTRRLREQLAARNLDPRESPTEAVYDRETLLHWNHLRDGRSGGWRERSDDRRRAVFRRLFDPWLRQNGYEPTLPQGRAARTPGDSLRTEAAIRVGSIRCGLREASARWPGTARSLKQILGIPVEPTTDVAVPAGRHVRVDRAQPVPHSGNLSENEGEAAPRTDAATGT